MYSKLKLSLFNDNQNPHVTSTFRGSSTNLEPQFLSSSNSDYALFSCDLTRL